MLTIWGRDNSVNVIKVLWCAEELGLQFVRHDVGGKFGGNRTPEYLAMNPMGLVPTVEDDGFVTFESNAIVRYLCAKYGNGTLYPEPLTARAEADRWMDWSQSAVTAPITTVFWNLVRTPPEKRDANAVAQAAERLVELFDILDRLLSGRPFVAGDRLTMGDIPIGAQTFRFVTLVPERPPMPNVDAWYMRLAERPGYVKHAMKPLS
jgi:glutathione S-transferase